MKYSGATYNLDQACAELEQFVAQRYISGKSEKSTGSSG
jgi:hypothetical protein